MAQQDLIQNLNSLSKKIDMLLDNVEKLQIRVNELEATNSELRKQHESDVESLAQARRDIEFLSISHKLASSPEALLSARIKISSLIKTIDSCINLLKED